MLILMIRIAIMFGAVVLAAPAMTGVIDAWHTIMFEYAWSSVVWSHDNIMLSILCLILSVLANTVAIHWWD